MQRSLRLSFSLTGAAALALASTPIQPVAAQEDGSAADLNASVGYYYQQGDLNEADGSGVKGRLAYNISNGLTLGANLSYDEAFDTRFTADIKYRFGSNGYGAPSSKKKWKTPAIEALSATPANRDVRVHDTGPESGWVTYCARHNIVHWCIEQLHK